jgi:hypothetical protein
MLICRYHLIVCWTGKHVDKIVFVSFFIWTNLCNLHIFNFNRKIRYMPLGKPKYFCISSIYDTHFVRKDMDVNEHERLSNITTLYPVICREWGEDREVFTTSGTYPWSFVTRIFHYGQPKSWWRP